MSEKWNMATPRHLSFRFFLFSHLFLFFLVGWGDIGEKKDQLNVATMSPKRKIIKIDHKCLSLYFCSDFTFGDEKYTAYGETPF